MATTVVVRIIKEEDKKVGVNWTFLETEKTNWTFAEVAQSIFSGEIKQCQVKKDIFPCNNQEVKHGFCSTSHKLQEEIRGAASTDMLEKERKFSMLYFTIVVSHKQNCEICSKAPPPPPRNAFSFLMQSARRNAESEIPSLIDEPKTRKEELRNSVLTYLIEEGCQFPKRMGASATNFLEKLCNLLWYIDGHASSIERESSQKLPTKIKQRFSGFNKPELNKHRKRELKNLSQEKLSNLSQELKEVMQCMKFAGDDKQWVEMRIEILKLAAVVEDYAGYLRSKNMLVKRIQSTPRSDFEKKTNVSVLPICSEETLYYQLTMLDIKIQESSYYHPLSLKEHLPAGIDRKAMYYITEEHLLKKGLSSKTVHYVFHTGGPKPSLHFVWKIPESQTESELIKKTTDIIRDIEKDVPIYERRITKREFKNAYGFVSSPVALRSMFKNLSSDSSVPVNLSQSEIDNRFEFALLSGDPNIVVDLRHQHHQRDTRFSVFFNETEKYLKEDIGVAVHERRHNQELYLAKAISFRDLHDRICERIPPDTPRPSIQWLRYQFQPINPRANVAKYYKGKVNIKMMVQKRQVRVSHVDSHYCAAAWKYMREYAVKERDLVTLVSMDDKHKVKCGEPSFPVAATVRGKKVIVGENQVMAVGDHDFTKLTLIPSVDLVIDIPDSIDGSFYRGDVFVGFKNSIMEPSSALRHSTELANILNQDVKPVLMIYSDGGPDHRVTYVSVQLALISLFFALDLDLLIALRTAPHNSWANPVERIMSVVNIGLQGVGVMRQKVGEKFEKAIALHTLLPFFVLAKANSVKEMRHAIGGEDHNELVEELKLSLSPTIQMLNSQMTRLRLKNKPFKTFGPAAGEELDDMWSHCLNIDANLTRENTTKQGTKNLQQLQDFLKTHCKETHYAFQVKKCKSIECTVCKAFRNERCEELPFLPEPELMEGQDHYKPFSDMFGKNTKDNRPSLSVRPSAQRRKMKFSPSVQHARNTGVMLQCEDCNKWRLVFSKTKLTKTKREQLEEALSNLSFTCGFLFDEIELSNGLQVFTKDHDCGDHIEKLYYSCGYEAICIHCGEYLENADEDADTYPQCLDCQKPEIKRRN